MKIGALLSNGKYWQNKAQLKNSTEVEQILYCLKVAKIGKMWDKQTAAKSGRSVGKSGNYDGKK